LAFGSDRRTIGSEFRSACSSEDHVAEFQDTEKKFLNDIFEAKLKYVTTRPYWNEPQARPKLY